jgi:hypothetical protein
VGVTTISCANQEWCKSPKMKIAFIYALAATATLSCKYLQESTNDLPKLERSASPHAVRFPPNADTRPAARGRWRRSRQNSAGNRPDSCGRDFAGIIRAVPKRTITRPVHPLAAISVDWDHSGKPRVSTHPLFCTGQIRICCCSFSLSRSLQSATQCHSLATIR